MYPVQVISGVPKVKRENNRSRQRKASISSPFTFADVLDRVTADHQPDEQPNDCYIVTYNANRQLQTYLYRPTVEYSLWTEKEDTKQKRFRVLFLFYIIIFILSF